MEKINMLQEIVENTHAMAGIAPFLTIAISILGIMLLVILAAVCGIFDYVKKGRTADELRIDIREALDETIQEKIRQLSYEHAELYKLRQWVAEYGEGQLDIEALGAETAKRVKALAIKMAEDELELAYADKAHVDHERSKAQRKIDEAVGDKKLQDAYKKNIIFLNDQMKHISIRIDGAKKRLDELIN